MGRLIEKMKELWLRSMMHRALLAAPPVVLLLYVGYVTVGARATAQYFTAKVEQGDISQVVQATGTINPVNTVPVGSVVSGNVVAINVDFNSKVKKGDILAEIDPVPFQNQLAQSQADYQNAVANVANLEAQIETARANVGTMKANVAKAHAGTVDMGTQLTRIKSLADQGVFSAQQMDDAQANYDTAVASEHAAEAQEKQSEAQLAATRRAARSGQGATADEKGGGGFGQTAAELLHDPGADRRDGDQPDGERGAAGGGQFAGAESVQHRAGPDAYAGVYEHGRGGRGADSGGGAGDVSRGHVSAGDVLRARVAGAHERGDDSECGDVQHDHRIR